MPPIMIERLLNLLVGAATIGSVAPGGARPPLKTHYRPAASASDALRGGWERIGGDFRTVIAKMPPGSSGAACRHKTVTPQK